MIVLKDLKYYTVKECAAILDMATPALRRNIATGKLSASKTDGIYLISEAALKEFAESRGVKNAKNN